MLKLIGVCLVVLGGSGIGWYLAGLYRLRLQVLREWRRSLEYMYGEIAYAATDMVELMKILSQRGEYMKKFFDEIGSQLDSSDGQAFAEIWSREVKMFFDQKENKFLFLESQIHFLTDLGKNLGRVDRDTQLRTLRLFQKQLEEMILQEEKKYQGQAKVCRVLGMVGGIFLAILLL